MGIDRFRPEIPILANKSPKRFIDIKTFGKGDEFYGKQNYRKRKEKRTKLEREN